VDVVDRHVLGMFFVGLPDTTVRLSDRFSATVIRGWTVDLVDHLNGYTNFSRIFAPVWKESLLF